MLRRMFGPKRGEVAGEWRKLHSEELNDNHWGQQQRSHLSGRVLYCCQVKCLTPFVLGLSLRKNANILILMILHDK